MDGLNLTADKLRIAECVHNLFKKRLNMAVSATLPLCYKLKKPVSFLGITIYYNIKVILSVKSNNKHI